MESQQQSTQSLHREKANPQSCVPFPPCRPVPPPAISPADFQGQTPTGAKAGAAGRGWGVAGVARPRASLLPLPGCKPKRTSEGESVLPTRFAGKSRGTTAAPKSPGAAPAALWGCDLYLTLPTDPRWGGGGSPVLVCLCPSSVSKAHAIHRNNIFIHLHDNNFFFAFYGVYRDQKI